MLRTGNTFTSRANVDELGKEIFCWLFCLSHHHLNRSVLRLIVYPFPLSCIEDCLCCACLFLSPLECSSVNHLYREAFILLSLYWSLFLIRSLGEHRGPSILWFPPFQPQERSTENRLSQVVCNLWSFQRYTIHQPPGRQQRGLTVLKGPGILDLYSGLPFISPLEGTNEAYLY